MATGGPCYRRAMRETSSMLRPSNFIAVLAIAFGLLTQIFGLDGLAQLMAVWALVAVVMQLPPI
jgi:hypothetical protein